MLIFSILFSLFRNILNTAKTDEEAVLLAFSVPTFPYRFCGEFLVFFAQCRLLVYK